MKFSEYGPWGGIHNTSLSLKFTNGTNKLECLSLVSLSSLVLSNAQAYWAHL
jgi:hypothetical protein